MRRRGPWCSHHGGQCGGASERRETELLHKAAIPHLGVYLKATKTLAGKDVCLPILLRHYLPQPRYERASVSTEGREGKEIVMCVCVYNGILLSHKTNEISPFGTARMDLEGIVLCKIEKHQFHAISLTCGSQNKQNRLLGTESRMVVVRGGEWEVREMGKGVKK